MDTLVEGVHFLFDGSAAAAGRAAAKALAVNVSDLSAKGAEPYAYLLSLAPPDGHAVWLDGFVTGLQAAQDDFALKLAGGDTVRTPGPFTVTITAIGAVPTGGILRRSGARPGDILMVSGCIGDAHLGLVLDRSERRATGWRVAIGDDGVTGLLARNRTPTPRRQLIPALRAYATATLDVSDGLAIDASRMAAASGVGVEIDLASLPLSRACAALVAIGEVRIEELVTGGDDYEILAAVAPADEAAFVAAAGHAGLLLTSIGGIAAETGLRITGANGQPMQLDSLGWDHFA